LEIDCLLSLRDVLLSGKKAKNITKLNPILSFMTQNKINISKDFNYDKDMSISIRWDSSLHGGVALKFGGRHDSMWSRHPSLSIRRFLKFSSFLKIWLHTSLDPTKHFPIKPWGASIGP